MNARPANLLPRVGRWLKQNLGVIAVMAVLLVYLKLYVPAFFSGTNMVGLALSVSMVGMVACTMLFCLASGDFDLSVEAVVAAAGVLCAVVIGKTGSVALGVASGLVGGALVGLANGTLIAVLGVNALIATLATMQIVRGLGFLVSNGRAVAIGNSDFFSLGMGRLVKIPLGAERVLEVPNPIVITIGCFIVFGLLLLKTTFGPNTLAIGGNREAARLAGIPVKRLKVIIFTLQGLIAGFAGVVLASRMASGQPNTSVGFSLDVISACVLGGVSLSGGVGSIYGVIIGVVIMGTVQNAMNLKNIEPFYQYIVRGCILLIAVMFDQYRRSAAARTQ